MPDLSKPPFFRILSDKIITYTNLRPKKIAPIVSRLFICLWSVGSRIAGD
jgi:hypothetical protein